MMPVGTLVHPGAVSELREARRKFQLPGETMWRLESGSRRSPSQTLVHTGADSEQREAQPRVRGERTWGLETLELAAGSKRLGLGSSGHGCLAGLTDTKRVWVPCRGPAPGG